MGSFQNRAGDGSAAENDSEDGKDAVRAWEKPNQCARRSYCPFEAEQSSVPFFAPELSPTRYSDSVIVPRNFFEAGKYSLTRLFRSSISPGMTKGLYTCPRLPSKLRATFTSMPCREAPLEKIFAQRPGPAAKRLVDPDLHRRFPCQPIGVSPGFQVVARH